MNFRCGNCGNLMDVEDQFLGQPVRCPHCQQIVQTQAPLPAPAPTAPGELTPEITFTVPPAHEQESIFGTADHAGDDLFGGAAGPHLDIPAGSSPAPAPSSAESALGGTPHVGDGLFGGVEMPRLALPSEEKASTSQSAPTEIEPFPGQSTGPSAGDAAATWNASETPAPPHDFAGSGVALGDVNPFEPAGDMPSGSGNLSMPLASESFTRNLPPRTVPSGMRGSLFIALVVIPLISYSILATIAIVILYLRPPQPSLEYLPDVEGDFQGAKRQKHASISYERLDPDTALPDQLKVALGDSIRLGDVQVTPQRVELGRVKIRHPDQTVDDLPGEVLMLRLTLTNISQDVLFSPNDPYFDRAWRSSQDSKPYTFLEVGERRFYGGALPWQPGQRTEQHPVLEGQVYQPLQPGQSLTTFVCTPPDQAAGKFAGNYKGLLLWRIQLRRGLVRVGQRDVPATGVVGVQFSAADIEKVQS